MRVYPEGQPGPGGVKAAFVRRDGSVLPVKVDVKEDVLRYPFQPLKDVVSFDPAELGRHYDLSKLSANDRQRLGLPPAAETQAQPKTGEPTQSGAKEKPDVHRVTALPPGLGNLAPDGYTKEGLPYWREDTVHNALENLQTQRGEQGQSKKSITLSNADEPIASSPGKIDETKSRLSDAERKVANWYAERGYDVVAIPREPDKKTADFAITKDGVTREVEIKTISKARVETIMSKATKGAKQGSNITVDARESGASREIATEALERLINSDKLPEGSSVTVIGDGYTLKLNK